MDTRVRCEVLLHDYSTLNKHSTASMLESEVAFNILQHTSKVYIPNNTRIILVYHAYWPLCA